MNIGVWFAELLINTFDLSKGIAGMFGILFMFVMAGLTTASIAFLLHKTGYINLKE